MSLGAHSLCFATNLARLWTMTINHDKVVIYCISIVQTQYICLSLANELISGRDYRQTFPEIDGHTLRIVCKTWSQRRRSTLEWTIFLSMAISLQFFGHFDGWRAAVCGEMKGLELNILKSQNINSFDVTAFDLFTDNLKEDHISQTITQAGCLMHIPGRMLVSKPFLLRVWNGRCFFFAKNSL